MRDSSIIASSGAASSGYAGPNRRQFLGGLALTTAALGGGLAQFGSRWRDVAPIGAAAAPVAEAPPATPQVLIHSVALRQDWLAFRQLYVTPEGRVLDTGNGYISHSEGQGCGMLAAQAADDQATFARILDWTNRTLRRRPDSLHAWRYRPGDANPVSDINNATDGDLLIAGALARAAVRWNRPDYAVMAARLARDILGLVRQAGARTVLLPGAVGFERPDHFVINPSYYTFALFADLAPLAPSPLWNTLRLEGTALMLQGRYGKWLLPPDWLRVDRRDGALSIAAGWPARFSFDAIRVPLHLAWAGLPAEPVFDSFRRYWTAPRAALPAWTDLHTGAEAPYAAPGGIRAVATLAMHAGGLDAVASLPSIIAASDYYGGGLVLLSRIAAEERAARLAA